MQQTQIRAIFTRTLGPLGVIGSVGGFVGDVLEPLGNFAPWVALLSGLFFIGSLCTYLVTRNRRALPTQTTMMPAFILVFAGSTLIFSGWSYLFATAPANGYLATNFEPIAQIQATLLGLEKEVANIKATTTQTAQDVKVVATTQAEIKENTTKVQTTISTTLAQVDAIATAQAQGFAEVQNAFAALQANQALIAAPATPQEWYNNARLYQLRGDTGNAIKAYEGYLAFRLEYVDPYLEYINLLKATEGIARTRQMLTERLNQQPESYTLDLMAALLLDSSDERLSRLTLLAQRAPTYGPVFYALVQEFSAGLRANFTQNFRSQQKEAYTQLTRLEAEQGYSRYYIDKTTAQQNLETAQTLVESYTQVDRLQLSFMSFYTYEGITIIVLLPEGNAQDLRFSLDDPTPVHSTGKVTAGAQSVVNSTIGPIPLTKGKHTLFVQYIDATGVESEIYPYEYTIGDIVINYTQEPFDFAANGIPVLFTVAVVDGAPAEPYTYRYSIDATTLDQSVEGVGQVGVIRIAPVAPGDHVLYIQADGEGKTTELTPYPFVVK